MHHFLAIFSKVHRFVQNSVCSPRSTRFVIFALGALFLATFSIVHEFEQNSVFSPRLTRFVIFALGGPLFSVFRKCISFCRSEFSVPEQNVLSFLDWAHYFLVIFSKLYGFVENSELNPKSAGSVIFALSAPLFDDFQESA